MVQMRVVMSIVVLLFIVCLVSYIPYEGDFSTLQAAEQYADLMPEYPEADNMDWYKPDYSTFFKLKAPSLATVLLYKMRIIKPYWAPKSFKNLLNEVTNARELRGYTGQFVQKLKPTPGMTFVIWGNLQGAFHSLVRDLKNLQQNNIIDNELRITDPKYYFVFDGNVISRSPYSLETLTLVVGLLKANPDHVVYIRGTHETDQYWEGFDMKDDLKTRLWYAVKRHTPLESSIGHFFNTLPLALYLVASEKENMIDVVRFSNEQGHHVVQESMLADFLSDTFAANIFYLTDKEHAKKEVHIKAQIISNHAEPAYYFTNGLRMLTPENDSTIWTILSSPTSSYQNRFDFTNDAFALLHIKNSLDKWTIELCKQSAHTKEGFNCGSAFNLLLGIPEEQVGNFTKTITIGSTMDLSMGIQRFNEYLEDGIQAAFRDQNMEGGVEGAFLRYMVRNDAYNPARARFNVERLLKEGVDILLAPSGTQTLNAYLDLIKKKQILVLFPIAGGRDPNMTYLIFLRPSYRTEGKVISEYSITKKKSRKIACFFPDDDFGRSIMEGAREIFKEYDVDYLEVEYKRNILEFKAQVKNIIDYNPDTLAFFCIPNAAAELINQIGINNLAVSTLIGISDLASSSFRQFLSHNGLNMTLPTVVPNPRTSQMQIVQEYRVSMQAQKLTNNTTSLEGYLVGRLFMKALKEVGHVITKERIVMALESMRKTNLAGFPIDFQSSTREMSHNIWIATLPEQENVDWELYTAYPY